MVIPRDEGRLEIQFDEWDSEYEFALEIQRGRFQCSLAGHQSRGCPSGLPAWLTSGASHSRPDSIPPRSSRRALSLKRAVQVALDWETVTPLEEIPRSSISNRVKRGLRWWQHKRAGVSS